MAAGKQLSDGNPDGTSLGQSTSDKISLYGVPPIAQRASATLSATLSLFGAYGTGASFVANTSTTVSGLFGFNSTLATQLVDALIEIRAAMVAIGSHKGGA